jgi:predicted DNA-binding protein (MmcQ/YjbR family)
MTAQRTKPSGRVARAEAALAAHAAAYPETHEDRPWGERAFKVKGKVFLFMFASGEGLHISVKLPDSADIALALPFAKPTGYGLGKSGWVSAEFAPNTEVPIPLLEEWIDESFRAIAPKKVAALLTAPPVVQPRAAKKKAAKKKAAKKKKLRQRNGRAGPRSRS